MNFWTHDDEETLRREHAAGGDWVARCALVMPRRSVASIKAKWNNRNKWLYLHGMAGTGGVDAVDYYEGRTCPR